MSHGYMSPNRHQARRNHVESIHYPNAFVYNCQFCGKTLKTKKARDWHMSKNHKDLNIKGITSVAGLF